MLKEENFNIRHCLFVIRYLHFSSPNALQTHEQCLVHPGQLGVIRA